MSAAAPTVRPDVDTTTLVEPDVPYNVFLWNDDDNGMAYVAHALQEVLGKTREESEQLMMQAHNNGKAVVWTGELDKARGYADQLGAWGLMSTVGKDS